LNLNYYITMLKKNIISFLRIYFESISLEIFLEILRNDKILLYNI